MAVNVRSGGGRKPVRDAGDVAFETPSGRLIADANRIETIVTDSGQRLGIRKLTSLDEMRLSRAVGMDAANQSFMMWCYMAAVVAEIDGEQQPFPQTQLECEAVIARIGDEGVAAMQKYAVEQQAARDVAARRDRAGKRVGNTDAEAEFIETVKK